MTLWPAAGLFCSPQRCFMLPLCPGAPRGPEIAFLLLSAATAAGAFWILLAIEFPELPRW
jgi:hypothetical protein